MAVICPTAQDFFETPQSRLVLVSSDGKSRTTAIGADGTSTNQKTHLLVAVEIPRNKSFSRAAAGSAPNFRCRALQGGRAIYFHQGRRNCPTQSSYQKGLI